ncbi:DUF4245 family protein [Nocardia seriolae]|uniref:Uncharacterized protein n=1 Tax=Nocardia seriolae TaxID=37332 RepID=A0A0B8N7N2_9NOCA|nr:hypothetical protein NS506_01839 [Nocardia seriolae]MTJ65992.1 DUF4245 family protein [Nocardia seriolae]MTJ75650.1 DUF4245 family protein [Nocardia seriolae]MTJ86084.1 DUF4245 family protein [Nocardia seriolae]MTK30079.1 DUF4245 family protein [Nocardia seriolae]
MDTGDVSYQKPRSQNDYKDLIWSLAPLVLICLVIAGIASQCSFSTGGPKQGKIPDFNVKAALTDDARLLSFPIRLPALPDTDPNKWTPNSGSHDTITGTGGGDTSTVGFITPEGTYMQLTQSNATVDVLAKKYAPNRTVSGTQQHGGHMWSIYAEPGTEPTWISDFGDVRILIKGAGNGAAFDTLSTAMGQAQPLPRS